MNNAELYECNNNLQRRDALECLEEFSDRMQWKKADRVIDIGCGDGSVTVQLIKKFVPENFDLLLGCDVSEKMVAFANDHHRDERTTFSVLDIEGTLPEAMRCKFDHAFSFYTLHWIKDQETAFSNIYELLVEGGQCLLTFLGQNFVFEVYRILAKRDRWSGWLEDVERFISPYNDSQNPEKEIRKLMNKIGFTDIAVRCEEKLFIFDSPDAFKKTIQAVDPFSMPKDTFEDFITEHLQVSRDMKLIDEANNNKPASVRLNYKLIIVYGKK